ncbi:hypothetical protein MNBD_PLANCTO02-855 [hydrothermal vent metagenome]|uniref:Uncharacterized protein n=1 Tax=hydrothermal vent metagenome TaxID=652676 RepID=A0A3B1DZ30_9ZZZZ
MSKVITLFIVGFSLFYLCSCTPPSYPKYVGGNPVIIRADNQRELWEEVIKVLHDHNFEIARENRIDGIIETEYKVGSGLFEPWHHESVGFENRLESSLQSIRRRVFVSVTPTEGRFVIGVEAFKELEDLPGIAANSAGGATFQDNTPLQRDLNLVVGQSTPSGWINQGRDALLEARLLKKIQLQTHAGISFLPLQSPLTQVPSPNPIYVP